jgi:hypothetical protein
MLNFFTELKRRNRLLYWFGIYNFAVAIICFVLMQADHRMIMGVNAWLKPLKFFLAVGIMIWTMGWILSYLRNTLKAKRFTLGLIITMFFENALIFLQAARGTTSHYNTSSSINSLIFTWMGIFILLFTIICILICVQFFLQKEFSIPPSYVWGIRLGILFFILFSIEGGMMLGHLQHTVGGADGGPGLPITNWSREHGDLRIAHFFGIHSLQILPLAGFFLFKKTWMLICFAIIYATAITTLLIIALKGIPLIR